VLQHRSFVRQLICFETWGSLELASLVRAHPRLMAAAAIAVQNRMNSQLKTSIDVNLGFALTPGYWLTQRSKLIKFIRNRFAESLSGPLLVLASQVQ
jgi:hypothetical protein